MIDHRLMDLRICSQNGCFLCMRAAVFLFACCLSMIVLSITGKYCRFDRHGEESAMKEVCLHAEKFVQVSELVSFPGFARLFSGG